MAESADLTWDRERASEFASRWLPAWTGNRPELLIEFYTDDVFYLDPGVPRGLSGRDALLGYLRRLLARNPRWVWTQRDAIAMAGGFVNLWHAEIPIGDEVVESDGVCLVFLRGDRICRNEIYFDRAKMLAAIERT